jgi:DtxR family Mn-dependent transcriptional regulator
MDMVKQGSAVNRSAKLSESQQMYLKAAWLIQQEKGAARVTDIARRLGVIKASVTAALRSLSRRGLLNYAPYDLITLTDRGRKTATGIMRRYEVLRGFLVSVLGLHEKTAGDDACLLEHRVSDEMYGRLADFIDCCGSCPRQRTWLDRRAAAGPARSRARRPAGVPDAR